MAEVRLMTPGVPLSRVLYLLRTRPHIRPVARAGILRLYDAQALAQLRAEIARLGRARRCRESQKGDICNG